MLIRATALLLALLLGGGAQATTTLSQSFGSSSTFTLAGTGGSWTTGETIASTAIDVTAASPVPVDYLITFDTGIPNSTLGAQNAVNIWIAYSEDKAHYTDNDQYSGATTTQSALRAPTNFAGPFSCRATQNVTLYCVIPSLRAMLGGILPAKFGLVIENQTNVTITATPAASYTPLAFVSN